MSQQVLEGTWEEIMEHADELSGRRVRLIVVGETQSVTERPLSEALAGIVGTMDSTAASPERHSATAFSELIAEKFRKQGLRIP